jgi:hypothetical protein
MLKVPTGGRKKKLRHNTPKTETTMAGREPQLAAINRTTSNIASATVVGFMLAPNGLSEAVTAAMPTTPTM